jgi:hypothetical protein
MQFTSFCCQDWFKEVKASETQDRAAFFTGKNNHVSSHHPKGKQGGQQYPTMKSVNVVFPEGTMGMSVGNTEKDSAVLYVELVVPGGVADQGGVKAGDVVSAVNGDHDAVVANHTPDLFVAYVSPLARPLTLTFERTISDDAAAKAPVAKPVAASDGEGSFATAPAAAKKKQSGKRGELQSAAAARSEQKMENEIATLSTKR